MMRTKNDFIAFRAEPELRQVLISIQRAYNLQSMSAAARAAIVQVARDRNLVEMRQTTQEETHHEPR